MKGMRKGFGMSSEDRKEKYDPVRYARKYDDEHYKKIGLQISNDFFDRITNYINITGESRAGFIKRCIKTTIKRDKTNGKRNGEKNE